MKKSKSILLVEDNEDEQIFFLDALKEIKNVKLYDIANNGKEALDKLQKFPVPPDLIFMDINMPCMNGIECLSRIIRNPKMKNIPVVILSTAIENKELVRELGAKAFLEKLSDYNKYKDQIEQIIDQIFTADSEIAY